MELLAIYGPASGYSCYSHQDIAVAVPEESGVTLYGLDPPPPQHLHIQSRPPLMEKFGGVSPNLAFRRREENSSSSASNQGVIVIWGGCSRRRRGCVGGVIAPFTAQHDKDRRRETHTGNNNGRRGQNSSGGVLIVLTKTITAVLHSFTQRRWKCIAITRPPAARGEATNTKITSPRPLY